MKRLVSGFLFLFGILLLCACAQQVVEPEKSFEERLLEGAQPLAENTGDEPRTLSLESIHYGSFSSPSAQELCALFKYESTVHVEGLDRTLAVIYAVEDLKVVASKDLGADEVQIAYLPSPEETEVIFCLASVTYQGLSTYHTDLFAVRESQWENLPVSLPDRDDFEHWYLANQTVLCMDAQNTWEIYAWNSETGNFEAKV